MAIYRIISWNVNGLRAIYKKGFLDFFIDENPDMLCIQETKAKAEQLPDELRYIDDYHVFFSSAERKGYSGVALFSRHKPMNIITGFGVERFDNEGRILIAEYENFILCNIYFPNGKSSPERLRYKLDFYDAFLDYTDKLSNKGKGLIICGDVNTAHKEIDLARPKQNMKVSGFLPEERAWIDKFIAHGFVDTFRMFDTNPGKYTWWDYKSRARERNVGWRIDYFFASKNIAGNIKSSRILSDIIGSDHCPIQIDIDI